MRGRSFGLMVLATLSTVVAAEQALEAHTKKGDPNAPKKCVHDCAGYALCKGNGNNSCKGKNSCADEGLVPKECSAKKSETECKTVKDKNNNVMCTWL